MERTVVRVSEYRFHNLASHAKRIVIEHLQPDTGWYAVAPDVVESTEQYLRYEVDAPPGGITELSVVEQTVSEEKQAVNAMGTMSSPPWSPIP